MKRRNFIQTLAAYAVAVPMLRGLTGFEEATWNGVPVIKVDRVGDCEGPFYFVDSDFFYPTVRRSAREGWKNPFSIASAGGLT